MCGCAAYFTDLSEMAARNAKSDAKIIKLSDGGDLQLWIDLKGAKLCRLA
jgi:hypothetical protein